MSIKSDLNYLEETKGIIKNAIISKGQLIDDNTPFRDYADRIENISTLNLEARDVNPTTALQVITPNAPYNGLSSVNVNAVTSNIDANIQASNIKMGVSILGVNGTFTSDANATSDDLAENMTAYVNGQVIVGNLPDINDNLQLSGAPALNSSINYLEFTRAVPADGILRENCVVTLSVPYGQVANTIGLTANILKEGETVLNITGTYTEQMKEYPSVSAMNANINNINTGEVVKVINNSVTTFYLKEMGTVYNIVNLANYSNGDTINLTNMAYSQYFENNNVIRDQNYNLTIKNGANNILDIHVLREISIVIGINVTTNNTNVYNYTETPTEDHYWSLSDSAVSNINSDIAWQNPSATIEGENLEWFTGTLLEGHQELIMKKLIREEDTLPVAEYIEATNVSENILGNN